MSLFVLAAFLLLLVSVSADLPGVIVLEEDKPALRDKFIHLSRWRMELERKAHQRSMTNPQARHSLRNVMRELATLRGQLASCEWALLEEKNVTQPSENTPPPPVDGCAQLVGHVEGGGEDPVSRRLKAVEVELSHVPERMPKAEL